MWNWNLFPWSIDQITSFYLQQAPFSQKPFWLKIQTKQNPNFPLITCSLTLFTAKFLFLLIPLISQPLWCPLPPPPPLKLLCQQLPVIPLLFDKFSGLSSGPFCSTSAESNPVLFLLFQKHTFSDFCSAQLSDYSSSPCHPFWPPDWAGYPSFGLYPDHTSATTFTTLC